MVIIPAFASLTLAVYFIGMIALHFTPSGPSPLQHAFSHYAMTSFRSLSSVGATANVVGVATKLHRR